MSSFGADDAITKLFELCIYTYKNKYRRIIKIILKMSCLYSWLLIMLKMFWYFLEEKNRNNHRCRDPVGT